MENKFKIFHAMLGAAAQGTSVVRGGFMTLAGNINETGHLDDGIFPSFSTYVMYYSCIF